MSVKMIAVDLDNTLLDRQSLVTEHTVRAVRSAMEAGALFVLNSGRMPDSMISFYRQLSANAPMICYNGALTWDPRDGREIASLALDADVARAISRKAEKMGIYIQAFWGGSFYFPEHNELNAAYSRKAKVYGNAIHKPVSKSIPQPVYKMLMLGENMAQYLDTFREEFAGRCSFVLSTPTYLECVSSQAGKGVALIRLGETLGIAPEEIMAFGDEQNDLDMITRVKYGYAMANASEEVRSQAPFIAPAHDEDGVAQVLEQALRDGLIGGKPC